MMGGSCLSEQYHFCLQSLCCSIVRTQILSPPIPYICRTSKLPSVPSACTGHVAAWVVATMSEHSILMCLEFIEYLLLVSILSSVILISGSLECFLK